MGITRDHFHHYTFGDTDEPDVSEQLKPINKEIGDLFREISALRHIVDRLLERHPEIEAELAAEAAAEEAERKAQIARWRAEEEAEEAAYFASLEAAR